MWGGGSIRRYKRSFEANYKHIEAKSPIFESKVYINIGSRNLLSPFGAEPFLEPMLTFDS